MKAQFLPWRQTDMYGSWHFECLIKPLVIHSEEGIMLETSVMFHYLFMAEILPLMLK